MDEEKIYRRKDGYEVFKHEDKLIYRHRYLAIKYIPNPENKCCVNHKDGDKSNNSLDNLEWVSSKENVLHAIENNMWDNSILQRRKLTAEQVEEIKTKYIPKKYSMEKLAKEYSVSYQAIRNLLTNKSYQKQFSLGL